MDLHLPTLLLSGAFLTALAASGMSLFGLLQQVYRGYGCWVSAQWLAAGGLALQASAPDSAWAVALAHALLLQWPVLTLTGLRRFHVRHPLPAAAWLDWALLLAACVAWAFAWLTQPAPAWHTAAFALGAGLLHGWAASRVLLAPAKNHGPAFRGFGVLLGLLALALLACGALWAFATPPMSIAGLQASGIALPVLAALFSAYFVLLFTYERTELELRESRRRLRFLANIDMLTRVPNRRYFQELARRVLERDPPGSAALVMFDIDHFKHINDVLGHAAGDRALQLVSRCTQKTLRTQDVAGRHGGDEFMLLLPRTGVQAAMAAAGRIVQRVQARTDGLGLPSLSLSFGVVQTQPGETLQAALHRADQALYEAKRQGRGRAVTAFGDDLQPVFGESRPLGLTPN